MARRWTGAAVKPDHLRNHCKLSYQHLHGLALSFGPGPIQTPDGFKNQREQSMGNFKLLREQQTHIHQGLRALVQLVIRLSGEG